MNRLPRRFHASAIAALIALVPFVASQSPATAGPAKPHHHAQSAVPHHNAGNNMAHHQQQQQNQQALIQQHYQHQQALIQQHQQQQQSMMQQRNQHQQVQAQQRQQSLANRKASTTTNGSIAANSTGAVIPGVAANSTNRPVTGLTNPRFSSRRQYSPYSTGGSRNGNNSRQNQQVISSLHSTMSLLQQADHDYNGHRARALHEVGQAIHSLSGQSHSSSFASNRTTGTGTGNRNGIGIGTGNGNNGQPKMAQATSDQHLRQAHQSLMNIQSQMTNTGGSGGSQSQRAHQHVQQATRELSVALNIR